MHRSGSGRLAGIGRGLHAIGPGLRLALPALGWLAGTAWQLHQATPPVLAWTLLLAFSGGLACLLSTRCRAARWPLLVLAMALLGAACTEQRARWRLADALPQALEGVDLLVTGSIAGLPQPGLQGTRFVFAVEAASHQGQPVQLPRLLSLGWYRGVEPDGLLRGPSELLRAGQRWQLTLRLKQPHGLQNPHGFDMELWLFERGIRASGHVRAVPGAVNELLDPAAAHPLQRLRQQLRDAIFHQVPQADTAGVLAALVLGDQASIQREDWALFRDTGIAHLMAISGLHVTMFAWAAAALVGRLWRCSPRAMLWLPAPLAALWGGLALATAYALLAGWAVPAQRTVAMIATVVLLRSAGLRWPAGGVLLAAACAVSLLDPWALLAPGFWLSFVAVGLLMLGGPAVVRAEPRQPGAGQGNLRATLLRAAAALQRSAWAGLKTQAVATVGLAPLTLLLFQQVSVVGFVANLLAIPLVTLLITPLALLGAAWPPLWSLAAALLQTMMLALQALAGLPGAVWMVAAAPWWASAFALLGGVLAVAPLPWRLRGCGVLMLLPLLWPPVQRPAPGQFELLVADVGQGGAVLVRTARHLLVYDTGPPYGPASGGADEAVSNAGERVLLPLLRARGERRIDLLMLSHSHADHVGGAAALLQALPVAAVSASLAPGHPVLRPLPARGVPVQRCAAGQRWHWDGVAFEVLHPAPGAPLQARPNADSCVLRVSAQGRSLLLTGDIEAAQEAALVQQYGSALRSEVLLLPHHGSRSSSTPAFLDAVAPQLALVQAGYRSRFGHPAPEVEARLHERGVPLLRSDRCGAYTLPGASADPRGGWCQRLRQQRYWHHPAGMAVPAQAARPPV